MKQFIVCLLLGALFGVTPPPVSAQQNQTSQQLAQEIEVLKNRVSELEKQLQVVENAEKMELVKNYADLKAKLADANAKLATVDVAKLRRELKDYNDEWLGRWSDRFVGIVIGIIGVAVTILLGVGTSLGYWLRSRADRLIVDEVAKSLNGFRNALKDLNILKTQLGVLEKEHTVSILTDVLRWSMQDEHRHPEPIKALREEALLDVLSDGRYDDEDRDLELRYKSAEILSARKSPRLVSPVLELLNSVIDSDSDFDFETEQYLKSFVDLLAYIHTEETYEGLTKFLNHLLTENPKHKELFVTETAFSLAMVSLKLNLGNSVSMLKRAIPQLDIGQDNQQALKNLARQFDIFNESEGIKEMLTTHGQNLPSEVVDKYLELLEKHDLEFVEKWRAENTTNDAESS